MAIFPLRSRPRDLHSGGRGGAHVHDEPNHDDRGGRLDLRDSGLHDADIRCGFEWLELEQKVSMTAENYPKVLVALCVWREARGQSRDARRGVLHVILNRAAAQFRGGDPVAVILWPFQFSSFSAGDPNAVRLPTPVRAADWAAWLQCCALADDPGEDPTGGATFYHSYQPGSNMWPDWATDDKQTAHIGQFRFYRP